MKNSGISAFPALSPENFPFVHSFANLPESFYTRLNPEPLPSPYLVCASDSAALLIGLDPSVFAKAEFIDAFSGNRLPPQALPLAAVYSGHQFGEWAGQLGDGRAHLLGEVQTESGPMELQLKGSGQTPYSRMGDGRAVLRSSIREFLCCEAMAGLGIPTTRALCVIGSDLPVARETVETAAVVTRMAPSFVRFGSFEHWYYRDRNDELNVLADFVINRHYPQLREQTNPYQALLAEATKRTAHLVAHWQTVGFMHGVMNTDNMSILGVTIDYGPFGFMEAFDSQHICNHSDRLGRYAYNMQPQMAHWNCHALGQALLPLIGTVEDAQSALACFSTEFTNKMSELLHAKLGLRSRQPEDGELIESMFALLQASRADFTLFFRHLGGIKVESAVNDELLRKLFPEHAGLEAWLALYRQRLRQENSQDEARMAAMNACNPKYVLRNHMAQIAIEKAQSKDFSEVRKLLTILQHPFDDQPENNGYAEPSRDDAGNLEISCSS